MNDVTSSRPDRRGRRRPEGREGGLNVILVRRFVWEVVFHKRTLLVPDSWIEITVRYIHEQIHQEQNDRNESNDTDN
jgi:hypothetical protein